MRISFRGHFRVSGLTVGMERANSPSGAATVTVGLLHIMIVLFDKDFIVCHQLGVIFYGCQIGGREVYGFHEIIGSSQFVIYTS